MIRVDLSQVSLGVAGIFHPCPLWYSAFVNFAASTSLDTTDTTNRQNLSILSVPRLPGVTSALALGALYGEVYKLRSKTTLEKISIDQLELGMQVSIFCGTGGYQAIGEVTRLAINDQTPQLTVGKTNVAVKSIREIFLLSGEIGKPKQFKKLEESSNLDPDSLFGVLADTSLPILRSLLMLRSTSGITESEFSLEFRDNSTGQTKTLSDLLSPIQANSKDVGTTVVLNTSEEDQVEWMMKQMQLSESEATPQITVMSTASAVLSQVENIGNSKVIAVIGRNERQITAAADAVRTIFAYSLEVSQKDYWKLLPAHTELVSFERSI